MEYKIEGLTKKQVALLDIMWTLNDPDEVEKFIRTLPIADRIQAQCLMTMLIHEALEECMPVYEQAGFPDASKVIAKARQC